MWIDGGKPLQLLEHSFETMRSRVDLGIDAVFATSLVVVIAVCFFSFLMTCCQPTLSLSTLDLWFCFCASDRGNSPCPAVGAVRHSLHLADAQGDPHAETSHFILPLGLYPQQRIVAVLCHEWCVLSLVSAVMRTSPSGYR